MGFKFYTQQGHKLLKVGDASSIKKALEYFKKANEIIVSDDFFKPRALYNLALGNYFAGNTIMAYKILNKASRCIEPALRNSNFQMKDMEKHIGGDDINNFLNYIETNFSGQLKSIDPNDDDFDENVLDLSNIDYIYPSTFESVDYSPKFTPDQITNDLLSVTFVGLSRTQDSMIYFDKVKGDVVTYIEGYLSSLLGDQKASNEKLASRILNNDPLDLIDEERYVLINQLHLKDFLTEYKEQTEQEEPFYSYPIRALRKYYHK